MQLIGCPAQPQGSFLERPGNMEPPAGVAQVAFELADHTGHGVGEERGAVAGVIAVDGGDRPGPIGLDQVLGAGPAAVAEPPGQPVGHAQVGQDDPLRSWGSRLVA
jgi:hypothetical protein